MHGTGHADVLVVLEMPGNKADAVPCERLPFFYRDKFSKAFALFLPAPDIS
jgi:hypothetical protein